MPEKDRADLVDVAVVLGGAALAWWSFWQMLDAFGPTLCAAGWTLAARNRVEGGSVVGAAAGIHTLFVGVALAGPVLLWRHRARPRAPGPGRTPAAKPGPAPQRRAGSLLAVAIPLLIVVVAMMAAAQERHCPESAGPTPPPVAAKPDAARG